MPVPLHLSTVLSRSASSLQSHITRLAKKYGNQNHILLFALSSNVTESPDLAALVGALSDFNSEHGHSIGCISKPVEGLKNRGGSHYLSCSFGVFDSSNSVVFRSTLPGRSQPQVGRWHSFRKKDDDKPSMEDSYGKDGVSWSDVWDRSSRQEPLPEALSELDPDEIETIIHFTDLAPEGLSNSLRAFKRSTKLGLMATSTPFITGRPVTLFQNRCIYESGAVGIALKRSIKDSQTRSHVEFLGVQPFAEPLTPSCEGNMINTLNDSNPANLLLQSMKQTGLDLQARESPKDFDQFSLGVLAPNGRISRIYRITAGDPSRGSLSLDSDRAPDVGTVIQFLHHPQTQLPIPERYLSSTSSQMLAFLTTPPDQISDLSESSKSGDDIILDGTFLAASENGFLLSRAPAGVHGENEIIGEIEDTWKCSSSGGLGVVEWEN
ncbi:hypothetical protein BDQ12DRAFT_722820 [Crucibulum laeve]|uniref:FIST domain-containing protein n=1 Tax=Crucibulum laeve TaxID=68775 RepID=A0A5C3M1V2_9AGAR|nr:hypothetical protein BDQ12DRAFT_722820 [Crucibulum laeve]